jgi:phytoene dehydrogenase-like protein
MGGRDRRICIIGAGPGGLSAAYFLKRRGYKNVTVLESTGRVGGKCLSLNYGGRSFDIGANYVTSDYTEVLRLAKEFDAALYTEAKMTPRLRRMAQFHLQRHSPRSPTKLRSSAWSVRRYAIFGCAFGSERS